MNDVATALRDIVVEEDFPHSAERLWTALTSGDLIGRWLMVPTGFEPVVGTRFTFQTRPGGAWDGIIHCRVLEVIPLARLVYGWKGGHAANEGYGAPLDTVVSWTLSPTATGTRLRLVHAGFVVPRNLTAFETMGSGWKTVVPKLGAVAGEEA